MGNRGPRLCLSGSGVVTAKTFAPGKDARFKSDLINTVINGPLTGAEAKAEKERLTELGYSPQFIKEDASRLVSSERAEALLVERGWEGFLARKREILAGAGAKAEAREEAKRVRAEKAAAAKEAKAKEKAATAEAKRAEKEAEAAADGAEKAKRPRATSAKEQAA